MRGPSVNLLLHAGDAVTMRRSLPILGFAVVISMILIPSGTVSGAEFPSLGELFDPGNINYPDIGLRDIFGLAQDLLTDPSSFASVLSLSGFVDFLTETFTDTAGTLSVNSIGAAAMMVCMLVIVLCIISAILGRRKARRSS